MDARSPAYATSLLFLVCTAATACNRSDAIPTSPTPLAAVEATIAAEPLSPRPEFLHSSACSVRSPFGVSLAVIIGSRQDLILRGIRFSFTDRFGNRDFPQVLATTTVSSGFVPFPSTSPITIPGIAPLPGVAPIQIPGASSIIGLFIPGGASRSLPFFLGFGCEVVPEGSLFISADTADRSGRLGTSEMTVRMGGGSP